MNSINNHILKLLSLSKKNKHGWVLILEAFIAIMFLLGFFIVTMQRQTPQIDIGEEVYKIQRNILTEIRDNYTMRKDIVLRDGCKVEHFVYPRVPPIFDYNVQLCDPDKTCNLPASKEEEISGNIYADDLMLAASLEEYNPTVIKIFFWQGRPHTPICIPGVPLPCPTEPFMLLESGEGKCALVCSNYYLYENTCVDVNADPIADCNYIDWDQNLNKIRISTKVNDPYTEINTNPALTYLSSDSFFHEYTYDEAIEDSRIDITSNACTFSIKKIS